MITRRKVLTNIALGSALGGSSIANYLPFALSPISAQANLNQLNIPPQYEGEDVDKQKQFNLFLQKGTQSFFPNSKTSTLGINGNYLGPTLRFQRGDTVKLNVDNRIGESASLHWHGFHLPPTMDGGPHQSIANNTVWSPEFEVVQFSGTYWYHSHMEGKSGEQVYRGLAGMIIVDDADENLDLPNTYAVDDIPLIVQDRRFTDDFSFAYLNTYEDSVMGQHGDVVLVNGTLNPVFLAATKFVRFRLLNASNARNYNFTFEDQRLFSQISSDGGLLEAPVSLRSLELAPAERADIVVQFNPGEEINLISQAMAPGFPVFPGAMSEMMRTLYSETLNILTIQTNSQLEVNSELPAQLNSIYKLPEAAATNTRQFLLSMGYGMRSGNDRGPGTGSRNGNGGGHGGGNFSINGRRMDMDFINERIKLNTIEVWELANNSPMMHPFHIHNGQFQLLDRNRQPPPANELGWKDTVTVGSGERVRIIMRFTDYINENNPYMYHCHILEHEDRGMMGQFVIEE